MPNQLKAHPSDKKFKIDTPTTIYYVVSLDNVHQTGEAFAAFMYLLSQNKDCVKEIVVVTSAWLYQLYVGKQEAQERAAKWLEENQAALEQSGISYTCQTWEEFFGIQPESDCLYIEKLDELRKLYYKDEGYRTRVDNLANQYKNKGGTDAAKEYVIRDSAAAFQFDNCMLAYPFKELNPAITYIANKNNIKIKYFGYRIDKVKENKREAILPHSEQNKLARLSHFFADSGQPKHQEEDINLTKALFLLKEMMEKYGVISPTAQVRLFNGFLQHLHSSVSQENLEETKHAEPSIKPGFI